MQMLATILKVPLLFLLTLIVTFPSLYVFSALSGSRLSAGATLRLLSFPDVLRWFMRRLFHVERTAVRVARPVLKHIIDVPLPADDVYASLLDLYRRVDGIKELLSDARSCSVRLVWRAKVSRTPTDYGVNHQCDT